MSGQGYHFAVSEGTLRILLDCEDERAILDVIENLYKSWDDDLENSAGGFKGWEALHHCLSDGTSNPAGGTYPLNRCFLGGRLLVKEDAIVNLVMPNEVRDVAQALEHLEKSWFQGRYRQCFSQEYTAGGDLETDCERFWTMIDELQTFYPKAAKKGRAVVFYSDDPH